MSQYKVYPAYKDSGVEWIGQVPEHWEVKRLRHVGRYSNSGVDKKSYEDQQTVELCNYTDVYYNEFISDDMPFMQATASTREIEQFTLKKGDVIITKDSEDPSDIGIPAFVPHDMPGVICGYHLTMIRALNDNYGSYIHRSLQSDHTKAHFFVESPGITRYGLNQNTIGNAPVALPPPDEQATIAATLDRETSRIDALIQKKTRFIELLKEKVIATAMTEQMYGDGEHIRLRHLVQIISRPVQLINEDEYIALGLYNRGRGLFHKPPTLGKDIGDSDFFYVEEGDLILSGQFAWEGAVTMASSTESGCVVSHRYPIVRGGAVATEYLFALLMTNFGDFLLNESSRGSAGRNRPLNINLLLNEKIRMPSVKTQEEIKGLIKLKATLEEKVKHSIDLLKERRAAFITAAVTGQIDLRGGQ